MVKVVGFTGLAGAGKTTAARFYCSKHGRAMHTAFAEPLKRVCVSIFPTLPRSCFYGGKEQKEAPLPELEGKWSGRTIQQHIGTHGFRAIDPDVWVKLAEHVIQAAPVGVDLVVFDDIRFPNEAELIRNYGTLYRLNRETAGVKGAGGEHASECHVPLLTVDRDLDNNGTLEALEALIHGLP